MQVPSSPRNPDWQPPRIPKLSYRNSTPAGEFTVQPSPIPPVRSQTASSDVLGSDEQQSLQSYQTRDVYRNTIASPAPSQPNQKKKSSLFGGLFTKEPTLVALAQVEADLKAKHGSATPQNVPHVSSRKMPECVPKVNSKWDGVPEAVKARKEDERERERSFKRLSLQASSFSQSRSTDPSSQTRTDTREASKSGSKSKFSDYDASEYNRSAIYERSSSYRSSSLYSSDSLDSLNKQHKRPPSTWSQSFRSPSGTSLPEITSFFPEEDQKRPHLENRMQSMSSSKSRSTKSSRRGSEIADRSSENRAPPVETIPEDSSAPLNKPDTHLTIMPEVEPRRSPRLPTSSTGQLSPHLTNHRHSMTPSQRKANIAQSAAFLAGEARPMEVPNEVTEVDNITKLPIRQSANFELGRVQHDVAERPHSSRARLGLRPSMVVRTDAAPWEAFESEATSGSQRTTPISPRAKLPKSLGIFAR